MICDGAVGVQGSASVTLAIGTGVALMVCAERQLQVPPLPLVGRNDSVCADEASEKQLRVPPLPLVGRNDNPGGVEETEEQKQVLDFAYPMDGPSTGPQNATFRMTSGRGLHDK